LLLGYAVTAAAASAAKRGDPGSYLFICAGDQARKSPDFLAVIDFDERSPSYVPGPGRELPLGAGDRLSPGAGEHRTTVQRP
jgi:hypothetical protein